MSETTENFWAAWNNIEWVDPAPVFFRLYYNEDGTPIVYSMVELPHAYVEIDASTYHNANMNVRVVDGKLVFKTPIQTVKKLQPAEYVTACDPRDVCVVVSADQPNQRWTIVENEIN